jgi:hypothetical protein
MLLNERVYALFGLTAEEIAMADVGHIGHELFHTVQFLKRCHAVSTGLSR